MNHKNHHFHGNRARPTKIVPVYENDSFLMNDRMNGGRVTYLFTKTFFHCVFFCFYFRQLFTDVFITLDVNEKNLCVREDIFLISLRKCHGTLKIFLKVLIYLN